MPSSQADDVVVVSRSQSWERKKRSFKLKLKFSPYVRSFKMYSRSFLVGTCCCHPTANLFEQEIEFQTAMFEEKRLSFEHMGDRSSSQMFDGANKVGCVLQTHTRANSLGERATRDAVSNTTAPFDASQNTSFLPGLPKFSRLFLCGRTLRRAKRGGADFQRCQSSSLLKAGSWPLQNSLHIFIQCSFFFECTPCLTTQGERP